MTERSWHAIDREARHPQSEVHRRFIQAHNRARSNSTDNLLSRISTTLSAG
jgi:hypothetical protein